jgi:hypothetical protein
MDDDWMTQPAPRIQLHPGGHYLQTEDGKPFFWLADTAWLITHRATPEEASEYLKLRARQGFTVIQISLLAETDGLRIPSVLGEVPFEDCDPLRPRKAYFDRIDAFFSEAAGLGLQVAVVACWGDKLTAPWGAGPRIFTTENLPVARQYGHWLGTRFARHSNLLWILGGDRPPKVQGPPGIWFESVGMKAGFERGHDWTPIWREMAAGLIEATQGRALITYHPQGGPLSSSCYLHNEPWLMLNSLQSGHGGGHDMPVWELIERDFAMQPPKPCFDGEPNYEDHPVNPWPEWDPALGYFRDYDVRKQCWRSVFAGACGVTYGHHSIWQWYCERHAPITHPDRSWRDALNRPGACQIHHLRDLLEARPFFDRIPDQKFLLSDAGEAGFHLCATRDAAGLWAAVYFPCSDQQVVLDLPRLGRRTVRVMWYDPRTGTSRITGDCETTGPERFTSPSDGPDWVLVLDDVDASYL